MRTFISPSLAWAIVYTFVGSLTVLAQTNGTASERKSDEADTQTEFAFNIFSDIAPILALFGEQFATQYLSQSFTWLDHIIFACVPLGIVTALSAAIRVQGAAWMRSFIGRARENRAAAELELMSSTSGEVCEIFNGKAIVRTMGRPKIAEIILFPKEGRISVQDRPEDNNSDGNKTDPSCGLYTLKAAADALKENNASPLMCEEYRSPWFHFLVPKRNSKPINDTESNPEHGKSTGPFGPPNVQVNVASGHSSEESNKAELFFEMVFAVILQLGIIAIACVTVVHEPTRRAIGYEPPSYGLQSYVVGSFAIFTSMLICSHAIESSTVEHIWESSSKNKDHLPMRLFWIQRAQTVSDQTFGSYIILGGAKRYILTSGRKEHSQAQKATDSSSTLLSRLNIRERPMDANLNSTKWATVTFTGVALGAAGFVVQFIGLRGLSYTVSLSHLGAILVMALVRALIRRRLGQVPLCFPVLEGRELDCLAYQLTFNNNMRDYTDVSMNNRFTAELDTIRHWTVLTSSMPGPTDAEREIRASTTRQNGLDPSSVQKEVTQSHRQHENLFFAPIFGKGNATQRTEDSNAGTNSRDLVRIRKRLGDLCGWKSDETQVVLALAQGIERFLQAFLPSGPAHLEDSENQIDWRILCAEPSIDYSSEETSSQKTGYVSIPITSTNSMWEVGVGQLEAVLSLWMASIEAKRIRRTCDTEDRRKKEKCDWRRGVSSKTTYRRVLGIDFDDGILRRDISWWIGHDVARSSKGELEKVDAPGHRQVAEIVIGFNGPHLEEYETRIGQIHPAPGELAIFSSNHLLNILSQHLLTSFMWAIVNYLPEDALQGANFTEEDEAALRGSAQLTERSTRGDQASYPCTLTHPKLSEIVSSMESAGLGSTKDILLCMIPALSWRDLLPNERMLRFMPTPIGVNEWSQALQCYYNVLGRSFVTEKQSRESFAYAVVVKTMDVIFIAYDKAQNNLSFRQKLENDMEDLIDCFDYQPRTTNALKTISPIYKLQKRSERFAKIFANYGVQNSVRFLTEPLSVSDYEELQRLRFGRKLPVLGFSEDHQSIFAHLKSCLPSRDQDHTAQVEACPVLQPDPTADLFGWTPLHYAILNIKGGFDDYAAKMIKNQYSWDQRSERDLCVGPGLIHLAAQVGSQQIMKGLLLFNLKADSLDYLGHSAFSYIAKTGDVPQIGAEVAGVLLSSWENTEVRDENGRTCLHWAAEVADKDAVSSCLRKGNLYSILEIPDHTGKTPLHVASQRGNLDVLNALLTNNARVHATDRSGKKALHYAAWDQAKETVRVVDLLCKRGADINCRDVSGHTPRHASILAGKAENALQLIERSSDFRPDIYAGDDEGATPLMLACQSGLKPVVEQFAKMYRSHTKAGTEQGSITTPQHELLCNKLAKNPFRSQYNNGFCSLHHAAKGNHGFGEVLPIILAAGVDINTRDKIDATPLLVAISHKKERNADKFGKSPLHEAAWHDCSDVFEYMVTNAGPGDWVNQVGPDHGYSTLSALCADGRKGIYVSILLEHPDIDVNFPAGWASPLHSAIRARGDDQWLVLGALLENTKIDLTMVDDKGRTPLSAAHVKGGGEIPRAIEEKLQPVA